eukprot:CAMPEP_0170445132 /NCGR_PEP_ID=MMETSP0117_2-20130122/48901_1 /TAXON_ID=400756 /ORGANISM="Durinskia baltica, Strain CSIRO CS-38" /LENGTH=30 /DNA_ID= /DNA_START= /DNA_END= /DNA_ORIENTATION=
MAASARYLNGPRDRSVMRFAVRSCAPASPA